MAIPAALLDRVDLPVNEVAYLLRRSDVQIRRYVVRGYLKTRDRGDGRVWITATSLDRYMAENYIDRTEFHSKFPADARELYTNTRRTF